METSECLYKAKEDREKSMAADRQWQTKGQWYQRKARAGESSGGEQSDYVLLTLPECGLLAITEFETSQVFLQNAEVKLIWSDSRAAL